MEKYVLTSASFKGNVVFGYSGGVLTFYHNESDMNEKQSEWLFLHFPFTLAALVKIKSIIKGKLEQIPPDISFDAFWTKYDKKVNRKRCEPLYAKLTEADKIMALMSILPYHNYLKRMNGRAKLDPENYLKREAFRNNWNQLNS